MNPYRIVGNGPVVVHFSGGRTSAYLLMKILDAHGGGLPENVFAVFCNTGREMPETLDFVRDFERETGCPVTWLEFVFNRGAKGVRGQPKFTHRVVDWATASRDGRPFADLIEANRGWLPTVAKRICTSELKVKTCERFMWDFHRIRISDNIIGFRYDEPKRWTKAVSEGIAARKGEDGTMGCLARRRNFPLVNAGVCESDVNEFWAKIPWGLKLDKKYGNCDMCFLKGKRKLSEIAKERPDLSEWWEGVERETGRNFRVEWSYKELKGGIVASDADDGDLPCFCFD